MSLFTELQSGGIPSEILDDLVYDAAERIASRINNEGLEILDDLVHDAAERIASRINNEGLKEQLLFLEQAGFSDDEVRNWLVEDGHLQGGHDPLSNTPTPTTPSP